MNRFHTQLLLVTGALLFFSATVCAGTLDEYYLQQFGEANNTQLQKAVLSVAADIQKSARCGMPLKHSLSHDWNKLQPTTQKVLAKQLASPALSGTEQTLLSNSGKFLIHYTTTGGDAVPSLSWVQTVAKTFDDVATEYLTRGWRLAPTINGAAYNIYMRNLVNVVVDGRTGTYYGLVTAPPNSNFAVPSAGFANAYASYMEIDKDFLSSQFTNPPSGGTFTPLQSLQITAAHEYQHSIQYGYNYFFDIWYAEATSTWYEDELYDSVNQLYNYIPGYLIKTSSSIDMPPDGSSEYGRWIFNRYLAERHNTDMIRGVWEQIAPMSSPSGADIPMTPVLDSLLTSTYSSSLGSDFFGFAKRVYTRDWSTHTSEISSIHSYSPLASYSSYPVNGNNSQTPSVTLPHYSFAYYKFTAPNAVSFKISLAKSSGIQTAVFKKSSGEISADSTGNSYTITSLNSGDEVALLIANTTGTDGENANFSTDGSLATVTLPPSTSSNTSHGCFIATAAYGSYLHPQVKLLRTFRDEHLLTNAPGRAFVAYYYRYSPPLADVIARYPLLRGMTRLVLTPLFLAIVHPVASGSAVLFACGSLCFSLRRRQLLRFTSAGRHDYSNTTSTTPPARTTRLQTAETP